MALVYRRHFGNGLEQSMQLAFASKRSHLNHMRKAFIYGSLAGTLLTGTSGANGAGPMPADLIPQVPACTLVQEHEVEPYVGVPAVVKEYSGSEGSDGRCLWSGSRQGATVTVTQAASRGGPAGGWRAGSDGRRSA